MFPPRGWREWLAALVCLWLLTINVRWWIELTRLAVDPTLPALVGEVERDPLRVTTPNGPLAAAGLQEGDRILAADGQAVHGMFDLRRAQFRRAAGDRIRLQVQRGSQPPFDVIVPLESYPAVSPSDFKDVFAGILLPGICIAIGLLVVLRRPRDSVAWALLTLMTGIAFNFTTNGSYRARLGNWFTVSSYGLQAASFWLTALGWMWFAVQFPDPRSARRLLPSLRWWFGIPAVVLAVLNAAASIVAGHDWSGFPDFSVLPQMAQDSLVVPLLLLGLFALGLGNLFYKLYHEERPNQRRRLRLVVVGLTLGIAPFFTMVLLTWALQKNMNEIAGETGIMAAAFMIVLAPLTMAYAILVERTLDVGVALRQGLQYALASKGVALMRLALFGSLVWFASSGAAASLTTPERLGAVGACLLAMALIEKGATALRAWLDRRFFRDAVNSERLLTQLGDELQHLADPAEILQKVTTRISQALHVDQVSANAAEVDHPELTLPLKSGDSLTLGPKRSEEPYSRADRQILEAVARQTGLALENGRLATSLVAEAALRERVHRELEIAREVQQRLFPQTVPEVAGIELAGLCRPAQSIGGDYFDYFLTPEGSVMLAIGDVAGKGIPAALLMASVQAAVRSFAVAGVSDLADLMTKLNRVIYDATPANRFVTFWCALYDPATRQLRYASAGHNPALLLRAGGQPEWLKAPGPGLGLSRKARYSQTEASLREGDLLLLYTDGVTEARNEAGDEFGEDRLIEAVAAGRSAASSVEACVRFAGDAPQHDDITVISLCVEATHFTVNNTGAASTRTSGL